MRRRENNNNKKIPSKWKRKKIERNAFFVCVIRKFWTEENFRNRSMDGRGQAARSSQVFWPLLICNWIKIESESQMWVIINAIRSIKLKAQHVSPIQSYADQSIANACPFQPAPPPFRVWFQIFSSKPPPLPRDKGNFQTFKVQSEHFENGELWIAIFFVFVCAR